MKYIFKIFMIAVAMVTAIPSFAVTDKEMEAAKTMAAKHYLRYSNNGSDYLDKMNPTSMAELTSGLKAKEKENIKSFNAVSVPKDYASWDQAKLVEYWSSTFFKSPGLKEDGKKCLGILAKNLKKIKVGAPEPKNETPQKTAASEPAAESGKDSKAANAANSPANSTAPTSSQDNITPADDTALAEAQALEIEAAQAQAAADAGLMEERPQKSSNTGWYIAILVVLIGVVIWLVMYASKSMKETGVSLADKKAGEKEIREAKKAAKEELNKMREQYASSLTSKNDELKQLKSKCEALESQLAAAKRENEAMRRDLEAVRSQKTQSSQRPAQQPAARAAASSASSAPKVGGLPPVVYLSNVNQKGLFTKASRSLNVDSSVFYMDIPDGHHGVFRVADNPEILDRLLSDPKHWLEGGCDIDNPEDADIATEIVTMHTGEAVFVDKSCRVTKKARIKFI